MKTLLKGVVVFLVSFAMLVNQVVFAVEKPEKSEIPIAVATLLYPVTSEMADIIHQATQRYNINGDLWYTIQTPSVNKVRKDFLRQRAFLFVPSVETIKIAIKESLGIDFENGDNPVEITELTINFSIKNKDDKILLDTVHIKIVPAVMDTNQQNYNIYQTQTGNLIEVYFSRELINKEDSVTIYIDPVVICDRSVFPDSSDADRKPDGTYGDNPDEIVLDKTYAGIQVIPLSTMLPNDGEYIPVAIALLLLHAIIKRGDVGDLRNIIKNIFDGPPLKDIDLLFLPEGRDRKNLGKDRDIYINRFIKELISSVHIVGSNFDSPKTEADSLADIIRLLADKRDHKVAKFVKNHPKAILVVLFAALAYYYYQNYYLPDEGYEFIPLPSVIKNNN